jgi:HK97 family phage prohead protease
MNAPARIAPPPSSAFTRREARTLPASFNEADNSFEVCWTTGAAVTRFDWYDGEYYDETLSLDPGAVRLDRLNDGGPVLDSHRDDGLGSLVGSIVPGSARIEGGRGLARARLCDAPDVASIVAKVKGGHLRKVSVGYMVHTYERIEHDGGRTEMRAVDWEPVEISLVSVPADPGAQIRSEDRTMNTPARIQRDRHDQRRDDDRQAEQRRRALEAGDIVSASFIRQQCRHLGFDAETTLNLVETFTEEPATRAEFLEEMVGRVAQHRTALGRLDRIPVIDNAITGEPGHFGAAGDLALRMQGALYARIAGKTPAEESREFMGASLIDMARGLLVARGERAQWLSPSEVYHRFGAATTSDFTLLMGGAMNQYLTEQYAIAPSPLMQLAKPREVRDFRDIHALTISGAPQLLVVEELGEYTQATLRESRESYRVLTFGRILSLSRQLIINDNLGAFIQAGNWYARSAAKTRAEIIVALIQSNPVMSDDKALFHADHGNLAASGTAITIPALSAARQAMRAQKDPDGETIIDVVPKYLVVGPAKETEAEQVLTQLNATQPGEVNPFPGKLTLLVDARLQGNAWYLFADPNQAPVLEYATLTGQGDSVFTDSRMSFEVDGVATKARIDFGAGVVDYRGAYKNSGN